MANVIDALVVTLGLDPANFTAGQKKAIEDLKKLDQTTKAQAQADKARHDKEAAEGKRLDREKDRRRQEEQRKEKEAAQAREKAEKEAAKGRAEAYTLAKEAALGFARPSRRSALRSLSAAWRPAWRRPGYWRATWA